jgi:uncharacterized membrane protein SirB2
MNPVLAIHVATVMLSLFGFVLRGVLRFSGSDLINRKWLKIAPHIVDTVLIVSAITLLLQASLNPLNTPWLLAKIIALIIYIGLGLIAFRFASSRSVALWSWGVAIMVFCYILAVAVTKSPLVIF